MENQLLGKAMIFTKYILKEIFKNQLIILLLLFLVCFCQKLIKMLGLVIDSNISMYLVFLCLGLNIPEAGKLLIPFSVFLSVLVTFYRLHIHNEIIAMYSCAVGKYLIIKSIFLFSGIVAMFAMINVGWLSPYCSNYQSRLLYGIKENINLSVLSEKKFQSLSTKYLTLFADSIQEKKLKHVFLVKKNQNKDNSMFTIVTSEQGNIGHNSDGSQLIILEKGTYYKIYNKCELCKNVFITDFSKYKISIGNTFTTLLKENKPIDHMSIYQLWYSAAPEARVELHWRLTLLISIFIMPMITMLLTITISCNYLSNFLLTIFLYTIFFVLHTLLRSHIILEKTNPMVWMWVVNSIYLLIALLLNAWDTFCMRKLVLIILHRN